MKTFTSKLLGGAGLALALGLSPAAAQVDLPGGANVEGGSGAQSKASGEDGRGAGAVRGKGEGAAGGPAEEKAKTNAPGGPGKDQSGQAGPQQQQVTQGAGTQSGGQTKRGPAGSSKFTPLHKSTVRSYFRGRLINFERVEVSSVNISVGRRVPDGIRLHPLPVSIFMNLPEDDRYLYFAWGPHVVIVEADTRMVVDIIHNAA